MTPAVLGPVEGVPAAADRRGVATDALGVTILLAELGFQPLLLTRIGTDSIGGAVMSALDRRGLSSIGVQTDTDRPTTSGDAPQSGPDPGRSAFGGFDPDSAGEILTEAGSQLVFQCTGAVPNEACLGAMNRVREVSALPFFVDFDDVAGWMRRDHARRNLLGARWLRIDARHLHLLDHPKGRAHDESVLTGTRSIQSDFALEAVVVTHDGLPVLIAERDRVFRLDGSLDPSTTARVRVRAAVTASLVLAAVHQSSISGLLRRTTSLTFHRARRGDRPHYGARKRGFSPVAGASRRRGGCPE
jgi:sugar/nucleoside kinase (ribokinase family)